MGWFHTPNVYDSYFLIATQKLHLSSDIYYCMNIMIGIIKEDKLTFHFGCTWLRGTNKRADMSTETICRSKFWHWRMETSRNLLTHFQHPRFASQYDQNQLITSDMRQENERQVVPKRVFTLVNWNERNNQRKTDKSI